MNLEFEGSAIVIAEQNYYQ